MELLCALGMSRSLTCDGHVFTPCSAWQFYGIDVTAIGSIRASFLLRVLVVDVQPFQAIMVDLLESEDWEVRYVCFLATEQTRI